MVRARAVARHLLRTRLPAGWSVALLHDRPERRAGVGDRHLRGDRRIVYRDAFSDEAGNVVPPEGRVTVSFEERGPGRTLFRAQTVYASNDERDQVIAMGVEEGFGVSLDQLERYLAAA